MTNLKNGHDATIPGLYKCRNRQFTVTDYYCNFTHKINLNEID